MGGCKTYRRGQRSRPTPLKTSREVQALREELNRQSAELYAERKALSERTWTGKQRARERIGLLTSKVQWEAIAFADWIIQPSDKGGNVMQLTKETA